MKNKNFTNVVQKLIDSFESWTAAFAAMKDDAIYDGKADKAKRLGDPYEKVLAAKECLVQNEHAKGLE